MSDDAQLVTRRQVIAGSTAITVPAIASVSVGATGSGHPEVFLDVDLPPGTWMNLTMTVHETGEQQILNSENQISDGQNHLIFNQIEGDVGDGYTVDFSSIIQADDARNVSPEIHELSVTIPEDPDARPDSPLSRGEMWDSALMWVAGLTLGAGLIGLASRSLAVAAWSAYVTFVYLSITSGISVLEPIVYVTLVLVFVGMAFKLVRLEGHGGTP